MTASDSQKFKELMATLGELYKQEVNKSLIAAYWMVLDPWAIADVKKAAMAHARGSGKESTFFPKPADLIRHMEPVEADSLTEWASVVGAMRGGSYKAPKLDNPVTRRCVDAMGGWVHLCTTQNNELHFKQRDFERFYEAYKNLPIEKDDYQLSGRHEKPTKQLSGPSHIMGDIGKALNKAQG